MEDTKTKGNEGQLVKYDLASMLKEIEEDCHDEVDQKKTASQQDIKALLQQRKIKPEKS
jgi:hypothetical protein